MNSCSINIRWRKLGGKDPPTLELIQKIQTLQKRLIARKEDIVDRETSIREKVYIREQYLNQLRIKLLFDRSTINNHFEFSSNESLRS